MTEFSEHDRGAAEEASRVLMMQAPAKDGCVPVKLSIGGFQSSPTSVAEAIEIIPQEDALDLNATAPTVTERTTSRRESKSIVLNYRRVHIKILAIALLLQIFFVPLVMQTVVFRSGATPGRDMPPREAELGAHSWRSRLPKNTTVERVNRAAFAVVSAVKRSFDALGQVAALAATAYKFDPDDALPVVYDLRDPIMNSGIYW